MSDKNLLKTLYTKCISPLPSSSLPCCFRGHTSCHPHPPNLATLTTPWQQGPKAWHHTCSEPIASLSSFFHALLLLPPPPPSRPHSYCHRQQTLKWSRCLCGRGLCALQKLTGHLLARRSIMLCHSALWTLVHDGEGEGEARVTKTERALGREKESKWLQEAGEKELAERQSSSRWNTCHAAVSYCKYQTMWHTTRAAPLQWSTVTAFSHAHASTHEDPTVRETTIMF